MKTYLLAALASLATLALVSCGAPSTPDFVEKAALSDLYEVEAGKIASEKGQSEAVKKFGQHMVEAHSKTSEELKGIVQSEKLNVALPTAPNKKLRKMIDKLNDAKPEDFDKVYAGQQIKAHKKGRRPLRCLCRGRGERRVEAIRGKHAAGDQATSRRGEEASAIGFP